MRATPRHFRHPIGGHRKVLLPVSVFPPSMAVEAPFVNMARPERFELPTTKFVAWYSIQLSYGRVLNRFHQPHSLALREQFAASTESARLFR